METRACCIINKTLSGSLINNRLICKGINLNTSRHGGLRSVLGDQLHRNPRRTLNKWMEEAKKMKNKHLNNFLYMLNDWKEYVLNYFTHRFTTSVIEGINNSIKTVKRMGYGFRNFANFKQRVLISFA